MTEQVQGSAAALSEAGRGHAVLERLSARAQRDLVPTSVMIELTRRCNLRCKHCYLGVSHNGDGHDESSIESLRGVLDELADLGCLGVTFTGGEPTLRPDWLDFIREAKRRRFVVTLLTNGTLVSGADVEELAGLRLKRVGVSLYGATAETHDGITGVPGSFERSVEALRGLRAAGVPCRVSNVLMRDNFDEFEAVLDFSKSLGCGYTADPQIRPATNGDDNALADRRLGVKELRQFFSHPAIAAASTEGLVVGSDAVFPATAMNCGAGRAWATIDASGNVIPCVGLVEPWGNIRDAGFTEIWRSEMAERFRARMAAPLNKCSGCDLVSYCTRRCPWMADAEDGDMCGPSSYACEVAELLREMWMATH